MDLRWICGRWLLQSEVTTIDNKKKGELLIRMKKVVVIQLSLERNLISKSKSTNRGLIANQNLNNFTSKITKKKNLMKILFLRYGGPIRDCSFEQRFVVELFVCFL